MRFLVSRRSALRLGTVFSAGLLWPQARKSWAAEADTAAPMETAAPTDTAAPNAPPADVETHGLSVFGDLDLPADFASFPYVNPEAPKGGMVSREVYGTFNSLNAFILRGDPATGMDFVFDSLMKSSLDEHDALYGLVAKAVRVSPDKLTYRFLLRKEARFHDGSPLTAKDVVFSLETLKTKGHPILRQHLRDLVSATAEADDVLLVKLAPGRSRDLPLLIAGYPIFSAAFYAKQKFEETSLTPPLGSGPYKVGRLQQGSFITFERNKDYWAADLPVNRGQANFDVIRYDYFSDRSVAFEAFKAGSFTVHEEFTSANWAKGYDFPAFKDGRVVREIIPDENISGIQGWFFNIRRPIFKDPNIREAIGTAFDFKWTNANLMYGSYERTISYFQNSDMMAKGMPDAQELALLEPFKDKLPAEVFGEPYVPPESDGSGQARDLLKRANELLLGAGCKRKDTRMLLPDGQPFQFEFLYNERGLEPHTQSFIRNLRQLGIEANIRVVDAAQYKQRMDDFDFDVTTERLVMSYSPGEELRSRFGSQAADEHGSLNWIGVKDPVVDELISKALVANSRDELVHICRSLDRVLRAGRYWVPHWYKPTHWIAHWDVFGRPDKTPRYDPGIATTWWYDDAKAKHIKFAG